MPCIARYASRQINLTTAKSVSLISYLIEKDLNSSQAISVLQFLQIERSENLADFIFFQ